MSHNNSYGNYAGKYLAECLPNISGQFGPLDDHSGRLRGYTSGVFYNYQNWDYDATSSTSGNGFILGFDASRMGYYKNNCKAVRPKSYGVYMWIRVL